MPQSPLTSREILGTLIGFETVSDQSNLKLVDWVSQYLAGFGLSAHITTNDSGTKANLFTTLGPQDARGICLHGHTDVVPVVGQSWSTPPFELTQVGELLHGRGTCDMKGFAACALAAIPNFLSRRLETPIHIALSYDEEVGCLGAPRMIQRFGHEVPKPWAAIVGEPTMMQPVLAHKGLLALETQFFGRAAHSSMPQLGVSAIAAAAEMVSELTLVGNELLRMPYPYAMDPPGPTVNVGVVQGGAARNIVAKDASLLWEIRFRDIDSAADLRQMVEQRVQERLRRVFGPTLSGLTWTTNEVARIPAFCNAEASKTMALVREFGAVGAATAVPYGAEAGQYADAGIDTVICGPGSIEQAHRPDEFVAISQLNACNRFMGRLAQWCQEKQPGR
jgi:acetylornithine deacetylase